MITKAQVVQWLENIAQVLEQNKPYLTELDSPIGDADHGANMDRGFKKVMENLPTFISTDIGNILKTTGMTLMSSIGGASGPLYGTFFMKSGMTLGSKEELTDEDLVELLESGIQGIVQRGRAQLQDKTMIDAWSPAIEALKQALKNGADTMTALTSAVDAAEAGMKATIPLQARKGRASYLGERSIGHQDPGATSTFLILRSLLQAVQTEQAAQSHEMESR